MYKALLFFIVLLHIYVHRQYNFSPFRIIVDPSHFHIIRKFENGLPSVWPAEASCLGLPAVWPAARPSPAQPSQRPSPAQPASPASPASQPSPAVPVSPSPAQPFQPASPGWKPLKAAQQLLWQKSGRNPAQRFGLLHFVLPKRNDENTKFLHVLFDTWRKWKSGINPAKSSDFVNFFLLKKHIKNTEFSHFFLSPALGTKSGKNPA